MDAGATVDGAVRILVQDTRDAIPVVKNGTIIEAFSRTLALNLLVGLD